MAANYNEVVLSVKDLRISFRAYGGMVQAVRGVSFDLHRGETLAIVGESGSGKSQSIRAIMGILANNAVIEEGEILYDGMDLTKVKEEDFHQIRGKRIGLIFQDPLSALNPIMKIGNQITESLRLNRKMKKDEAKKVALELMKSVGIPHAEKRFDQYPFQFSGGMRQRIVIAIALAADPEILICDEPTTALDVTIQAQILELMKSLQEELGMAIIMITHDLGVVAQMCDEVIVMYAGSICEQGTADEIFYNPRHEYTKGLMRSIPTADTAGTKLQPITGTPIDLLNMPKGCPFAPRCDAAMKICLTERCPRMQINEDHAAACWMNVKKGVEDGTIELEGGDDQ